MVILLDSNIWLKELGLNSSVGSAVRFYLKQNGAQIALPEVVKLEVESNFKNQLIKFVETINNNYNQLLAVFGSLKEIVLPDEIEIRKHVSRFFSALGIDYLELPFSLEVARSSFLKLINKEPPNGENNQQFKDGVIWAHCLELLNNDDVIFVTQDKGFFLNRDYKIGLALNLLNETKQKHNTFTIISSINDLLEQIKIQIEIDKEALIKGILDKLSDSIQKIIQDNDLELIGKSLLDLKLFITEQPSLLYIKFIFNQKYKSVIPREIDKANVEIEGHCMYNTDTLLFTELQNNQERVTYKLEDGEEKIIQNVSLIVGSIIIGHKTNYYSIRTLIE
jgi:hypothetical protein